MKLIYILLLIFSLTACSRIYTYLRRNNDTEGKSNIKSKYNDNNIIFTNESLITYDVHQVSKNRELNFKLELLVIPGSMSGGTKIKYKYYYGHEMLLEEERKIYLDSTKNHKKEITSVMENSSSIFLHPPRSFSLKSLQLSPFPQINLPVKQGAKWSARMFIGTGWGDLNGKLVKYDFSVDEVNYFKDDTLNYTAIVKAKSYFDEENQLCTAEFYFDSRRGFTKMVYDFADSTKVHFTLIQ